MSDEKGQARVEELERELEALQRSCEALEAHRKQTAEELQAVMQQRARLKALRGADRRRASFLDLNT